MYKKIYYLLCTGIFLALPLNSTAETTFVTDKLKAGIHQDKTTDSVIIKVIPTGTALEIVKREGDLTQIRDPEGTTGWISNQFLSDTPPATSLVTQAEERANNLENELETARTKIKELEAGNPTSATTGTSEDMSRLQKENEQLKQNNKTVQLKVGELQATLAELRNKMSQVTSDAAMAEKIEQLNKEKSTLEKQLAEAQSANPDVENISNPKTGSNPVSFTNILIAFCITLIIGMGLGAYVLDLANRRRHGGFRI